MMSFYLKSVQKNLFIKSLCFDISYKKTGKPDYKWLQVTASDYEWLRVTITDYEPDYKWLRVSTSQTTSDYKSDYD